MKPEFKKYRELNLKQTKEDIRKSVKRDLFILQAIGSIEELQKIANMLVKRLREWYELYLPELSKNIASHDKFVELIIKKDKKELLKKLEIKNSDSMGADLSRDDLAPVIRLAKELNSLYAFKKEQESYLDKIMQEEMPNVKEITGSLIGAKLLMQAGSLKRFSEMPSTTLQLLGAEKALFRHLKTRSKCPKYGLLHEHPLISKSDRKNHGKIARMLADKISIAAKVDYFKGKFIGDKLKAEIEKKFGKW